MRYLGVAVMALLAASAAQAQLWQSPTLVLGAAGGVTWELSPDSRPDQDTYYNNSIMPSLFVGLPVMGDTMVRLRALDLPHEVVTGDTTTDSRLRGVVVGVDYFMVSSFGRTVFSGGLGTYKLDLEGSPTGDAAKLETWDFGWYVGVGEWVAMTKNTRLTFEIAYHTTAHPGRPQLVQAALGVAFGF
jgi:hypothetical protein